MCGDINDNDDRMDRMNYALDQLEDWQRTVLLLDVDNEYETRNEILSREVGITTQMQITIYLNRLKNKLRELIETGNYVEKHKGNKKPTLKGF